MECKDKFYTGISIRRLTGINRNIVECKGGYIVVADDNVIVLIETLWNVKCPEPALVIYSISY